MIKRLRKYIICIWIIVLLILLSLFIWHYKYIITPYIQLLSEDKSIKTLFQTASWAELYSWSIPLSVKPQIFSVNRKSSTLFISTSWCVDVGYIEKHRWIVRSYNIWDKIVADQKKLEIYHGRDISLNISRKILWFINSMIPNLTYTYQPLLYYPQEYKLSTGSMVSDIIHSDIGFDTGIDSKFLTLLFYNQYIDPTRDLRTKELINETFQQSKNNLHLCNFSGYIMPIKYPMSSNQDSYFVVLSQTWGIINFKWSLLSDITEDEKTKFIANVE